MDNDNHGSKKKTRATSSGRRKMENLEMKQTEDPNIHLNPMYTEESTRAATVNRQSSEPSKNLFGVQKRRVDRSISLKETMRKSAAEFFGIVKDESKENEERRLWNERRMRMLQRKCGKLKQSIGDHGFDVVDGHANDYPKILERLKDKEPLPEERPPVYQLTFEGLAYLTTKLKKKVPSVSRSERVTSGLAAQTTPAQTPDSLYETTDLPHEENFFEKPVQFDEVDSNQQDQVEDVIDAKMFASVESAPQFRMAFIQPEKDYRTQISTDSRRLISNEVLEKLQMDFNRREYGMGIFGRFFNRKFKKLTKEQRKVIDNHIDDHRPFFTYWITTVQILIFIISISAYGFGPFGFGRHHKSGLVKVPSLSLQQIDYYEFENFWIGSRPADLIHLGAKFTPCMRKDNKIHDVIMGGREKEKETGCCIRNDGSGCIQTLKEHCSPLLSTWSKWNNNSLQIGSDKRTSGPVCGQDPINCDQPASVEPYKWPDDITKWPICLKKHHEKVYSEGHISCELIGRPCCIGIYGQCHITTRELCDFYNGFFHEEATLCSQVSCLEDICGMIPFYSKDVPDQFYRVLTPIFLHAGILHLFFTIAIQMTIMRDIEKLTGSLRIGIIYLFSGVGGYLASSIFVPYRAEVGPSGAHFGLLACLFVEIIKSWDLIENPMRSILKESTVPIFLFTIGFLPWIDNYAHIFGFLIGFLLSIALMPFITIKSYSRQRKLIQICICLITVAIIFIVLFVFLYFLPIYDCEFCKYLNCIPITKDWCINQDIQLTRVDIL